MRNRRQPAEPYRIKSIEPIALLSRGEREEKLRAANYNLFKLDAPDIYIDLLTDSGTGAMSVHQWAALMLGDETYAGARSFRKFEKVVKETFRKKYVIPCHQGRMAENLVFSTLLKPGQFVPNNTHFDTTRGNVLHKHGVPIDLPSESSMSEEAVPFKGNMDTVRLEEFIREKGAASIPLVIMTITNNSSGGQPVSMANIHETAEICHRYHIPFFFDCARFAENAYFIKRDEPGYSKKSIQEIVGEMFAVADGAMMSAKKDGLANIGGFVALNDRELYEEITELLILIEGFPTYGGLAGRDLEALAVGLQEVTDFEYLDFRIEQVAYFGRVIKEAGMPIIEPTGGHAVFIDAGKFLPHIPAHQFPGHALAVEFYREGCIRSVEIGSLMFGGEDPETGKLITARQELVRMALPRRVYTNSHLDYIGEVAGRIANRRSEIPGYEVTRQPRFLRHFTCDLATVSKSHVLS